MSRSVRTVPDRGEVHSLVIEVWRAGPEHGQVRKLTRVEVWD
jgi:hypothetical protein